MVFVGGRAFERGFLRVGKVQSSFGVHFFLILLMFVVFDVEVVLLLGLLLGDFSSFFCFCFVFFFLLFGLYLEWFFNKLV
jgi:NADH-ubiquinone oxidoreductase chain 3